MTYTFELRSDLVVVGHNPEAADMDHPNGEVVGERFYMLATDPKGYTRQWGWFPSAEACELAFEFLAPPVDEWTASRPRYGSEAFGEAAQDSLDAAAERDAYDCPAMFSATTFQRVY
jgi:hypothetical protein